MSKYILLNSSEYINENGYTVTEEKYGYVDENGNEIVKATFKSEKPKYDVVDNESIIDIHEPTQLDRIEEMLTQLLGK